MDKKIGVSDWSDVGRLFKLSETLYVRKDNAAEGYFKVTGLAKDFHNPDVKIVTFYSMNIQTSNGELYSMEKSKFLDEFEAREV